MSLSAKLATLAVAVTSILALVGPASASAAVTENVNQATKTLTLTGDDNANTIELTVSNGKIAFIAEGQPVKETTLDANEEAIIIVETGADDDTVNASALLTANYKSLVVNGGEDNDTIAGGARAVAGEKIDTLNGDAGNDLLVGFKGDDIINGGEGTDLMVWNNGDGNDTNNGGAGTDESVFNGAPVTDNITVTPQAAAPGRVLLERTVPTVIKIDIEAEKTTVNGLAGDDTLAGAAGLGGNAGATPPVPPLTTLTLSGGDGNDQLTGGDGADTLNGDAGNDNLVGFKGNDTVNGGEGNDVMVWNNGDGNDTNNGDAGSDESVFNGANVAPNNLDTITVAPGAVAGRVLLERTVPTLIKIDIEAEKTTVNGLAGDDTLAGAAGLAPVATPPVPPLTTLTISGGEGNDKLTGGDGADTLNGDAGNDNLVGFKGNDTVNGGAGNDVMVWNNGDGNDVNEGGEGTDESVFNGANVAPNNLDTITVAPGAVAGRVLLHRTAPTNIEIDIKAEKTTVNGLAGDDKLAGANGLSGRTALTVSGGDGNDQVTGGDGADTLNGDAGNDTVTGGAGKDAISGQAGNDQLFARDKEADTVRGGADTDSAQTDQQTLDSVSEVENLDATPEDKVALLPRLGKVKVVKSGKRLLAKVTLTCPSGETNGCHTTLKLETAKGHHVLGAKSVKLGHGAKTTAVIRLNYRAAGFAKHGKLPVRIRIKTRDGAGNTASRTVSTTLRIPRH
jgi:Ca2+-binding RTX toxin-like protein